MAARLVRSDARHPYSRLPWTRRKDRAHRSHGSGSLADFELVALLIVIVTIVPLAFYYLYYYYW